MPHVHRRHSQSWRLLQYSCALHCAQWRAPARLGHACVRLAGQQGGQVSANIAAAPQKRVGLPYAQAYLDAGEVDRAITVLGEAYKIDRRHLRVSCLLGFCALQKGKLDDAKKYFSFVVRMELDNASARLGLKRLADHTATPPALAALQLAIPKKIELKEDVSQISVSLGTRLHIYFGCAANGVILGTIFVLVAVWAGQDLFGQILDTRAARFWLIVGPVIGGFIGLLFAPRTIRKYREQTAAKGKNTGALREGVKVPMHSQDVTSKEPSTVPWSLYEFFGCLR